MTVTLQPVPLPTIGVKVCGCKLASNKLVMRTECLFDCRGALCTASCVCLAIYADEVMVGFTMYDADNYYIVRFMIDERYQGKGYGHAAMRLLLEQFERDFAHPTTSLSYVPGNEVAERLYERVGFRKTGEIHESEIAMERPLQKT